MVSQCTYRCVVLPDPNPDACKIIAKSLNAPTGAWCSLTSTDTLSWDCGCFRLNAPTGAWCSLTRNSIDYRDNRHVSMHLQVRGAP